MLKLKLQYFGHLMRRAASVEKTMILGKLEGRRRGSRGRDGWMASLTLRTEEPDRLQFMGSQKVRHRHKKEDNALRVSHRDHH